MDAEKRVADRGSDAQASGGAAAPSGPLCSPADIVARSRRGDPAALDAVTRCYGERLLAVGRRRCAEDAGDAVQDALIEAHTHLGEVREPDKLEGWLVRLVQRACGRLRRGKKNDPTLHVSAETAALMDDAAHAPDLVTLRGEWAQALGEALLALAPTDRMILLLSEAEGWSGPEVARELGLTSEVVRARLSRIRRRLRTQLAPVW